MLIGTEKYFFFFILYSVIGWGYETAMCSIRDRAFVNRGFLNGPYCPIYGVGAVLFLLLLGNEKNALLIFLFGAMIASAVEYLTSFAMEKMFGARWWDYSDYRFNLNGRVCLGAAAIFGAFAVVLIKLLHPAVLAWASAIPSIIFHAVNLVTAFTFICDLLVTLRGFHVFNGQLRNITEDFSKNKSSKGGESYMPIPHQQRRLMRAFPKMRSLKYGEALKKLRLRLNNHQKGLEKKGKR